MLRVEIADRVGQGLVPSSLLQSCATHDGEGAT
jgi:hypothetical protein